MVLFLTCRGFCLPSSSVTLHLLGKPGNTKSLTSGSKRWRTLRSGYPFAPIWRWVLIWGLVIAEGVTVAAVTGCDEFWLHTPAQPWPPVLVSAETRPPEVCGCCCVLSLFTGSFNCFYLLCPGEILTFVVYKVGETLPSAGGFSFTSLQKAWTGAVWAQSNVESVAFFKSFVIFSWKKRFILCLQSKVWGFIIIRKISGHGHLGIKERRLCPRTSGVHRIFIPEGWLQHPLWIHHVEKQVKNYYWHLLTLH